MESNKGMEGRSAGKAIRKVIEDRVKSTRISDYPKYARNPFMESALQKLIGDGGKVRTYAKVVKDGTFVDRNGEVLSSGDLIMMQEQLVDNEQFVKLYGYNMKLLLGLTERAMKLFFFVTSLLGKGESKVLIDIEFTKEQLEVGDSTVFRAIGELIAAGVLARTKFQWLFYVNPTYIFNGDRMVFINKYVRETAGFRDANGKLPEIGEGEDKSEEEIDNSGLDDEG